MPHLTDAWYLRFGNILGMSPALRTPSSDWAPRHRVSGFLSLPDPGQHDPMPRGLDAFLAVDPAPVFMGFGSLTPKDGPTRQETLDLFTTAARLANCRAVIQGLDEPGPRPGGDVFHVNRVPHRDIFPRCAAVVHHAGAGTTQTVLSAGVPSVGVPHVADQFFWSAELHRLGLGTKPLKRTTMSAGRLATRLRQVTASPDMRDRAARIAERMQEEDGVGTAVALIEEFAGKRTGPRARSSTCR
jgi:UDP:flavonoid glycosyltransferase YjiC (YdhE family)